VSDKNTFHFLIFVLLIITYFLYKKSEENSRMYQILNDQDITIQQQKKAIEYQQIYINQIEYHYKSSYNPLNSKPKASD
jgi:hypothetical protein